MIEPQYLDCFVRSLGVTASDLESAACSVEFLNAHAEEMTPKLQEALESLKTACERFLCVYTTGE